MHRPDHIMDAGRSLETDNLANIAIPNQPNQFGPNQPNQFGPTNPNQYQYNWDQNTINPYIQQGSPINNPAGVDQIQFLQNQGIVVENLDESSLAFLPSMDRLNTAYDRMNTQVGMARTGLGFDMSAQQLSGQQNLLNMTGGQGLASVQGIGGASANRMMSGLRAAGNQYRTGLNQSMAGFQSDILGMQYDYQDSQTDYQDALTTALGNIMASGEDDDLAISYVDNLVGMEGNLPEVNQLPTTNQGNVMFNGRGYMWDSTTNSYKPIPQRPAGSQITGG
jgi:hypothetical protein